MRAMKKLRSRKGFTLTELMVAIVVLGLLTLAVSVGTSASLQVYYQTTTLSESQVLASTLSQAITDELRFAGEIKTDPDGALLSYTSRYYGKDVSLSCDSAGKVLVGATPLIGDGAYTSFTAALDVAYEDGSECFQVVLTLFQGTEPILEDRFPVRALNPSAPPAPSP